MWKNKKNNTTASDIKIDSALINKLAGTSGIPERIASLNWIAKQPEEVKILFAQKIQKLFDSAEEITPEFLYAMVLIASNETRMDEEALSRKRRVDQETADEISRRRIEGFRQPKKRKSAVAYQRIKIDFYELIKKLREEHQYSWSEVCAYLQNYHNLVATRAYIQQSYVKATKEISEEEQKRLNLEVKNG